jgi:hypothetical protein
MGINFINGIVHIEITDSYLILGDIPMSHGDLNWEQGKNCIAMFTTNNMLIISHIQEFQFISCFHVARR